MKYQHMDTLVYCLVVSLILAACAPQQVISPTATPIPDNITKKIDIGGRGIYLICLGAGNRLNPWKRHETNFGFFCQTFSDLLAEP